MNDKEFDYTGDETKNQSATDNIGNDEYGCFTIDIFDNVYSMVVVPGNDSYCGLEMD